MSARKRKHSDVDLQYNSDSSVTEGPISDNENEVDISLALAGSTKTGSEAVIQDSDDDEDLAELIHDSITKRNVKGGTEILKKVKGKAKMVKGEFGGGSFQSMGLHPSLLRSLTLQGYRIPTPIQRLSIPILLSNPPRDLVGMARTGSGKSLAYMIPLVQRLGGRHSTTFGARALILLPTRELALQILKVGKELTRGWHAGEGGHVGDSNNNEDTRKSQSLRWGLIVGGEELDEQFEMISNNPDIIIATPGRLLHLLVEMNLDLKSIQYIVFDEADRLFEMGFETALTEIIQRLPASRQTLLFSATLPKSLVEFTKAGLQDPKLVRLDAESKISLDLKMAFFHMKQAEKDACLLALLRDIIRVPLGSQRQDEMDDEVNNKKKGKGKQVIHVTAPHQTLVFAATKHHVEYLTSLLSTAGYSVSHIYGTLDQTARTLQMDRFRRGTTNILVVTDVAARGIDIPILENVVNYDFPQGARVFVHRVGRTARAGRQGWAWSFITTKELPYLLDLQLFLGRPLKTENEQGNHVYAESLVLGAFPREKVDEDVEYIKSLDDVNHSLASLKEVMKRGQTMYERSKGKASPHSYKRAKKMMKDPSWIFSGGDSSVHPIMLREADTQLKRKQEARHALLKVVNSFTPGETVFEISNRGNSANASLMKDRRRALSKATLRIPTSNLTAQDGLEVGDGMNRPTMEMANEEQIAAIFDTSGSKSYRDEDYYMSHYQKDASTEKGYSLKDGASFTEQVRRAAFDLAGDEALAERKRRQLNWDKKKKRFVKGDGVGADNVKLVRTENGTKLPATYRSGRFDEWKVKTRVSMPRVGEAENAGPVGRKLVQAGGKRFKHHKIMPAKPLDKYSTDYERKVRQLRKKEEAFEKSTGSQHSQSKKEEKQPSRYAGRPITKIKSELKTTEQIRKSRKLLEKRKAKNARPSRKKSKR